MYLSNKRLEQNRKHKLAELGIGYFSHPNEYLVGEIFLRAGLGSNLIKEKISDWSFIFYLFLLPGSEEDDEEEDFVDLNADYVRLFLQSTFGGYTEIFEGGVSLRICYIDFYKIHYSNIDFPRKRILFEPTVFMKFGPPVFKLQTQLGHSFRPFEDPEDNPGFYDDLVIGAGFNIRLNIK